MSEQQGVGPAQYERLRQKVTAWVTGPGEEWAQRIETTGRCPKNSGPSCGNRAS
ncbi:hypothetical protein ACWV95_31670 [Streptomyces albus]